MSASSRKLLVGIVLLVAAGAALVFGIAGLFDGQLIGSGGNGDDGDGEPGVAVTIEILPGTSAAAVGELLAEADVVSSARQFRQRAREAGIDARIQAGLYEMETGMSFDQVVAVLEAGPVRPETMRVTIPEGLTVGQTLARLATATPHDVEDYRDVLDAARADRDNGPLTVPDWVPDFDTFGTDIEVFEGLLFPLTYEFALEATPADVLQRLLNQTATVMSSIPAETVAEAEAAGVSRYDALVIASLVEREARVPGEWDEIGGVIRNRLAIPMRLQIDATLLYAAGAPDGGPTSVDTGIQSPYNTYQNDGLPPTPISGARPEAVRAAFDPGEHDFLYYVVAPECDGSHRFAETLDVHNRNVQAFRNAGRCQ